MPSDIFTGHTVKAVLGPTNTGKTHYAIERMVAHSSGVIGLPLRLLAREVYQRVADKVGPENVALITGEEKIVPPKARYSVCTVEAMPSRTDAAFVAIDEVQLAGDLERGHIFTDRILNVRGREETLLLGAGTMTDILRRLLPGVDIVSRPRMSHLAYAGSKKITRLPRRSAIVAFSADEVYAIAELIRRQRGGAAVVMGALSPRTRNAQVELYQSGDVEYLVATDAIGMGLNLDVDHVAFAQRRKFDGYGYRELTPAEMGQIAGRAGRHVRDGTFGVSGHAAPLDDETVRRIEGHEFDPVKVLQWRSRQLDFSSIAALRASLEQPPELPGLTKALPAVDQRALEFLARNPEVTDTCASRNEVELLWDACVLPDYRKIAPAQHADIISQIFFDLVRRGHVDEDYMAEQVLRADRTDGEIDTLSGRIAQIRTWTYVANRPGWLRDPVHWQEKTRAIEDKLSDALHERLTKRFVDRRTSVLMKRLRENVTMEAEISASGDVTVEGHHVGQLDGFRFAPDKSAEGEDAKAIKAAAAKALATEFEARAERFAAAGNADFALGSDGILRWLGQPVASLTASEEWLKPRIVLLADEQLTGPARDKVAARAERFVSHHVETHLKPLVDLGRADELSGIARGIGFRLIENYGIVPRREIAEEIKSLDQDGRAALRRYGVRFGFYHIYIPALIKPAPAGLLTLLWALQNDGRDKPGYGDVVQQLATGRTSLVPDPAFDTTFYKLAGYRHLGSRAVRVDILERLADLIRPALQWREGSGELPDGAVGGGRFFVTPAMMSILGATAEDMEAVLGSLGYRHDKVEPAEFESKLTALKAASAPAQPAAEAPAETAAGSDGVPAPEPVAMTSGDGTAEAPSEPEPAKDEPTGAQPEEAASAASEQSGDTPEKASDSDEAEEPKPVMVWYQVRPDRHRRNKRQGGARPEGEQKGKGKFRGKRKERPHGKGGAVASARPPRREKPVDPDSPFAKLAALKEQLKK
ncbi:helicase-related protein [Oricola thermophila]|uniref:DEAD/DEAH box helicase n=1 Tax=Oricola thermophila TaxID=2742145 RepID=A0A6N1VH56_9HYPH|nr:helicase-related protein [Oricola thermophila]QKV20118.1 DEAD/DEAH box helicase [Oricola thermophila]